MRFARSAIPDCSAEFEKGFNTKSAKTAELTKKDEKRRFAQGAFKRPSL
jgi:hypothetical protein